MFLDLDMSLRLLYEMNICRVAADAPKIRSDASAGYIFFPCVSVLVAFFLSLVGLNCILCLFESGGDEKQTFYAPGVPQPDRAWVDGRTDGGR